MLSVGVVTTERTISIRCVHMRKERSRRCRWIIVLSRRRPRHMMSKSVQSSPHIGDQCLIGCARIEGRRVKTTALRIQPSAPRALVRRGGDSGSPKAPISPGAAEPDRADERPRVWRAAPRAKRCRARPIDERGLAEPARHLRDDFRPSAGAEAERSPSRDRRVRQGIDLAQFAIELQTIEDGDRSSKQICSGRRSPWPSTMCPDERAPRAEATYRQGRVQTIEKMRNAA